MTDLIYCEKINIYDDVKKDLKNRFNGCVIKDASDDIHEYRFSINLEDDKRKEYLQFMLKEGLANMSLTVQIALMDNNKNTNKNIILEILEELKKEKK